MRLQLIHLVLLAAAGEDIDVATRLDVYDDGWITVVNQSGAAGVNAPEGLTAKAHYAVDMISGATRAYAPPDAVTSATRFSETRVEGGLEVGTQLTRDLFAGAGYTTSLEPDYATHALSLRAEADLFERMSRAGAGFGASLERAGRVDVPAFEARTLATSFELSWQQVISKGTVATALGTFELDVCDENIGCHASPYRYVAVDLDKDPDEQLYLGLGERHPALRARSAAGVRLAQSIAFGLAAHGGYRAYADSWSVTGHTADVALTAALFGGRIVGRVDARSSWQSSAAFYRERYEAAATSEAVPRFRTADPELAGLSDLLVGARLSLTSPRYALIPPVTLTTRAARLWYRYPSFPSLPARDAWLLGAGLSSRF